MKVEKDLLPLIKDNIGDLAIRVKNDVFLGVVNQQPPEGFIKTHPIASNVKYIPIDKVETMLTNIFQEWHVEILDSGQLLNSVFVTVRLHYTHPITKEKLFQDGIGAAQIQVDKGENASNLSAIKPNAIMLGLPAAKSFAIKDAAEHIGIVFGRDINRKDTLVFSVGYDNAEALLNKLDADADKKQAIIDANKQD
jgi:hypothetical protein